MKNKLNILHLQNKLNLTCGISKTIFLLAKNSSEKLNNFVICLEENAAYKFEKIGLAPVKCSTPQYNPINIIINILFITRYCREKKIDIIHSHHRYFDLITLVIGKVTGIKTVITVHSKIYGIRSLSYLNRNIIACGSAIKKHLVGYYRKNKLDITIINNMIDEDEISEIHSSNELKDCLLISKDKVIIGFIGNFEINRKGLDVLVASFKDLLLTNSNIHLMLTGGGKDKKILIEMTKQFSSNVTICDAVENVFDYFRLIDILVLPSRTEPFSLSILEAGRFKKPVVGSNIDGTPEIISHMDNGLLFESENINELNNCLQNLISDEKLRIKLGENLYSTVTTKYDKSIIIPQYINYYKKILT